MNNNANYIKLSNLSIGYKNRHRVNCVASGINATIHGGELTCLIGPNGAGKSTLMRTLAGFLPKIEGSVSIAGKDLGEYSIRELSHTVGIVLTEKPDTGKMTVAELVMLGRSPYTGFWGIGSAEDRKVAERAMAAVGITALAGRRVTTLSDGERQKTMVAKALAQETPIILLDEPTAFLDFPSKVETMGMLRDISRTMGKVVFMSTHDLDLALQAADTLWLMKKGIQPAIGSPEDLAIDGSLASFFGRDSMEFDTATGLFNMKHNIKADITVNGTSGQRLDMLCKALRRNGLNAVSSTHSSYAVTVGESQFTVRHGTTETSVSTIAEVIRLINV